MNESIMGKQYLLGTQISFLIMSFIITIIAITVQNDIWPFLQTTLPPDQGVGIGLRAELLVGIAIPAIWGFLDWSIPALRYGLLSLLIMFCLQIVTEYLVSRYFFVSMVIPTSILYIGYRLLQLLCLQRTLLKTSALSQKAKCMRTSMVTLCLFVWGAIWFKLTFVTFPQIIYQIF